MKRSFVFLMVATSLVGCRSRATPISNPFMAPDRVPPPATRMPAPGAAVPYYDNGQSIAPPVIQEGGGGFTPGASYAPQGPAAESFAANALQSQRPPTSNRVIPAMSRAPSEAAVTIPSDDQIARLDVRPSIDPTSNQPAAAPTLRPEFAQSRWIQPGQPIPAASAASVDGMNAPLIRPTPLNGAAPTQVAGAPVYSIPQGYMAPPPIYSGMPQTVEISELPPAGRTAGYIAQNNTPTPRRASAGGSSRWIRPNAVASNNDSGVRQASSEQLIQSDQLLTSASDPTPRTRARYGIANNYGTLRGRLERSASTGQWKLRYIPIDGATDEFGGSVVIENSQALGELEPGDFVELRGALNDRGVDDASFAASYRIASLQQLAD